MRDIDPPVGLAFKILTLNSLPGSINNNGLTIQDKTRDIALVGGTDCSIGAVLVRDLNTNHGDIVRSR
jgi:hypothetical protein